MLSCFILLYLITAVLGRTAKFFAYCSSGFPGMLLIKVLFSIIHDISERKKHEREKEQLIRRLENALDEIKTLRGLIPICSFCKKIRDDKGYWNQLEIYISEHTEAKFTHGLCDECYKIEKEKIDKRYRS